MPERLLLVVSLWIHPGQETAFEAFERDASRIMARHGGRIDSAVRLAPEGGVAAESLPFEVHIVSFPDQDSLDSYRADPETAGLAVRRPGIIAKTEVRTGRLARPY